MTAAQRERAALVESLREHGPDAPTLCEGWTARDLAAHLVVRERRLDAAPGILVPQLAGYTDRVQAHVTATTDWEKLVDMIAAGPPLYSPFKLLDPFVNVAEMFIHNEDVRRAQPAWEPRELDDHLVSALAGQVTNMARMGMRNSPARILTRDPRGSSPGCGRPRGRGDGHRRARRAVALRGGPRTRSGDLYRARRRRGRGPGLAPRILTTAMHA